MRDVWTLAGLLAIGVAGVALLRARRRSSSSRLGATSSPRAASVRNVWNGPLPRVQAPRTAPASAQVTAPAQSGVVVGRAGSDTIDAAGDGLLCVRCLENAALPPGELCLSCEREDLALLEEHGDTLDRVMASVKDGKRSEWPGQKHDANERVPGAVMAEAALIADQAWERPLEDSPESGDDDGRA